MTKTTMYYMISRVSSYYTNIISNKKPNWTQHLVVSLNLGGRASSYYSLGRRLESRPFHSRGDMVIEWCRLPSNQIYMAIFSYWAENDCTHEYYFTFTTVWNPPLWRWSGICLFADRLICFFFLGGGIHTRWNSKTHI